MLLVIWREIYVHMNTQITLACVSASIQTKILSIKSNAEILEIIWVIWVRKLYICSTNSWKPTTTASETPCTVNTVILYIIHANHRLHRQLRNLDFKKKRDKTHINNWWVSLSLHKQGRDWRLQLHISCFNDMIYHDIA